MDILLVILFWIFVYLVGAIVTCYVISRYDLFDEQRGYDKDGTITATVFWPLAFPAMGLYRLFKFVMNKAYSRRR